LIDLERVDHDPEVGGADVQVVRCAADPNLGLFECTAEGLLHARPAAEREDNGLALLELTGLIIGKVL
jgi:hypothetical protein